MSIKLTNIRPLGRRKNVETGRSYNVKKGRRVGRSTDLLFYTYRGHRNFISDADFYSDKWVADECEVLKTLRSERVESLTLAQAESAESWRRGNSAIVSGLLHSAMNKNEIQPPSRDQTESPELWDGPTWNWYLFELVIS